MYASLYLMGIYSGIVTTNIYFMPHSAIRKEMKPGVLFFLSQPKSEVNYVFLNTSSSLKQPNQGRAASNDYIHLINLPIIFSIVWSDFVW